MFDRMSRGWGRRSLLTAAFAVLGVHVGAQGQEAIGSAYSTLDLQEGCTVLDRAAEGEGDWALLRCEGHAGYPVYVADDDQRMSLDYGHADEPGAWESFSGFNRVGETIEWRRAATPAGERPFATIHRWFVSDGQGGDRQVLVVNTVIQPEGGQSCAVGYVDAQAQPEANEAARRIADRLAGDFVCGVDVPRYHGATPADVPQPVRASR